MRFRNSAVMAVIIIFVSMLALLPYGCDMLMGFDRNLHSQFQELQIGVDKTEVVRIFGAPRKTDVVCCLPQRGGFEAEFDRAKKSNAVEYLLWKNGVNWYYCIGFDENGKLAVKLEGCS